MTTQSNRSPEWLSWTKKLASFRVEKYWYACKSSARKYQTVSIMSSPSVQQEHVNVIRQNLTCRGVACPFIFCDTMAFFLLQEFEIKSSYNEFLGKAKRRIYKLNKLTINANFPTGVYSTRYREIAVHSGNKISTVHLRHKFQIRKLKIFNVYNTYVIVNTSNKFCYTVYFASELSLLYFYWRRPVTRLCTYSRCLYTIRIVQTSQIARVYNIYLLVVQVSSTKVLIFLIQNLYMTIYWIRNIKIFVDDTWNIFRTNDVHKLLFYDRMKI